MAETPPSLHQYLYAYANPTVYTDPDGHCAEPLTFTACVTGLAALAATTVDYLTSDRREQVSQQIQPESVGGQLLSNSIAFSQSAANTLSLGYFDAAQQQGAQGYIEHTKENVLPINAAKNAYTEFTSENGDPVLGALYTVKGLVQTASLGLLAASIRQPAIRVREGKGNPDTISRT